MLLACPASTVRVLLIHNPEAGDREFGEDDLRSLLTDAGHDLTYASLADDDWASTVQPAESDLVVVAGGDGAVRKVVLAQLAAPERPPLAILPIGTANNVARSLGLIGDAAEAVASWDHPTSRPLDVGWVEVGGERRPFVEGLGGGLFADLIVRGSEAERRSRMLGHALDRALLVLHAQLRQATPVQLQVTLDDTDLSGDYLAVEALNTRFAGPNVALAPGADAGDGLLDIVLVRPSDRDGLLAYVEDRLKFGEAVLPKLDVHRGRQGSVRGPGGWRLHVDDEPWESSRDGHMALEVQPAALIVLGGHRGTRPA